jgi:Mg2+ and Co2+ transporter CorA
MLRYFVKRSQGEAFEEVKRPEGEVVWIVGEQLSRTDIITFASDHDLDTNILDDVFDAGELSRTEFKDGVEHVFLRTPRITKRGAVLTSPVLFVVSDQLFITLSERSFDLPIETIRTISTRNKTGKYSSNLLLANVAALLTTYEDLIQHTARVIRDTGQRLRTHEVTNRDFIHFVTVENNLNEYQLNLDGMLGVANRLRENTHSLFDDDDIEALDDIMLHIRQLLVTVDTSAKRVESIRNAYSTIANNNLNERMKLLTVFTVLMMLPSVIYSMLGMNYVIPFQSAPWAFGVVVGISLILVGIVYAVAKRFRIF